LNVMEHYFVNERMWRILMRKISWKDLRSEWELTNIILLYPIEWIKEKIFLETLS
jgi:hypothetical protein